MEDAISPMDRASRYVGRVTTVFAKYVFWLVGAVGIWLLASAAMTAQRQVLAMLVFLFGALMMFFYWLKWFAGRKDEAGGSGWPPVVTPCPDFLTRVNGANGEDLSVRCMDFVGVSTNGRVRKADPKKPQQRSDPAYVFEVPARSRNERPDAYRATMCRKAAASGLVWSTLCGDNEWRND